MQEQIQKPMKIAIVGISQNPSTRITSHNTGWVHVVKALTEFNFPGAKISFSNAREDWSQFDVLVVDEGVNFKGTFNLFGGVSSTHMAKAKMLCEFEGPIFGMEERIPDYNRLFESRGIPEVLFQEIEPLQSPPNKLVLGDSHSISVYEPGWALKRIDGKTLHGFLKMGLSSLVPEGVEKLRFYAGNIDIRFHLAERTNPHSSANDLIRLLGIELDKLINERGIEVELIAPLPIESEDRIIPKTGQYKNKNFMGSWTERSYVRNYFVEKLSALGKEFDCTVFLWTPEHFENLLGELDEKCMEAKSSVHLAPSHYMFKSFKDTMEKLKSPAKKKAPKPKLKEEPILEGEVLDALDLYHKKSMILQRFKYEGNPELMVPSQLELEVGDDLMMNVPIYDMLDRKYAAFSSFPEALFNPSDPKGNFLFFAGHGLTDPLSIVALFYLFRLCGSGINYKPRLNQDDPPFGTHGFGNFWLVEHLATKQSNPQIWFDSLEHKEGPFTDNKGYLLPQFSFPEQKSGHLKHFIRTYGLQLVRFMVDLTEEQKTIMEFVDECNSWLIKRGFKRQTFVLSATAADIAEYMPERIKRDSMIYAGSNAKKCIKALFGKTGQKFESKVIEFLSERYNAPPYSVEDSRLCDVIRYWKEYQSPDHIAANGGFVFENNCLLKRTYGPEKYKGFVANL